MPARPLSARAFFRDPLGFADDADGADAAAAGLVRMAAGGRPYVLVRDPEAIWRVLVTDGAAYAPGKWKRRARRFVGATLNTLHGAEHRERRLLLQPALARRRVDAAGPALAARARDAATAWAPGVAFTLRDELDPLSLTMAGDVLLSTDLAPAAHSLAGSLRAVMTAVPRLTPPLPGTPGGRARARADAALAALVAARRDHGGPDDDLLGTLLAAGLPEATVRGELLAFLLAAADEPPSALEAAWWLLGRHPEADAALAAELHAVLGDRPPQPEDLARLPVLDGVLRETLRLLPPARHIDRCPMADVELGGETVRAGTNVVISPLVTHHDARLHDDAAAFRPERWAAGRPGERAAYVPFGAGAHTCIGEPLARAIMGLTLAAVAQRYRLRTAPDAPAPRPGAGRLVVTPERRA